MGVWQAERRGQVKAWPPPGVLSQVPPCSHWHWACLCPPPTTRRSCSIDRSPGAGSLGSPASQRKDLGRSESLRVVCRPHRIFRPSDLIHGEVLGKGCFGQAIKVWGVQGRDRPQVGAGGQSRCDPSGLPPPTSASRNPQGRGLLDFLANTHLHQGLLELLTGKGATPERPRTLYGGGCYKVASGVEDGRATQIDPEGPMLNLMPTSTGL